MAGACTENSAERHWTKGPTVGFRFAVHSPVDDEIASEPARWDLHQIERFMLVFGPISSLFDYATHGLLLLLFGVDERAFHRG
jgi:hypothetical protein